MKKLTVIFFIACFGCGRTVIVDDSLDANTAAAIEPCNDAEAQNIDAGLDSSPNLDAGIDSTVPDVFVPDAGIDVADTSIPIITCDLISGTYWSDTKVLFDSCADPDASIDSNITEFSSGFDTGFPGCNVLNSPDTNGCSGSAIVSCDDGTQTITYTDRYYVKNINANYFTVISDVEYKDDVLQTTTCHKTLIVNYSKN